MRGGFGPTERHGDHAGIGQEDRLVRPEGDGALDAGQPLGAAAKRVQRQSHQVQGVDIRRLAFEEGAKQVPPGQRRGERSSRERSEEHTSELQSLMRISYAVFCLKKKTKKKIYNRTRQ